MIGVGVFLGALDVLASEAGVRQRFAKAGSLLAVLYGAILAVGAAAGANDPLRPLAGLALAGNIAAPQAVAFRTLEDPAELASLVRGSDRPSLLYVTADWCVTCDIIEKDVFEDATVRAKLAEFQLLKADITESDPASTALMSKLGVVGPPTMLFVDSEGREIPGSRLIGGISAQTFLEAARLAKGR